MAFGPSDFCLDTSTKLLRQPLPSLQYHHPNWMLYLLKSEQESWKSFVIVPQVWFEKRLAYTRSVAASSMVGYILGLGDRHLMNILIDESTAELVHIDLGIAFDQGTVLPIPEMVPFRLTRDIVDPMGVIGVEGILRRCCEFTMHVMRQQHDNILTLLEVLLYDPLYVWTVTPQKAAALQRRRGADSTLNLTLTEDGNQFFDPPCSESFTSSLRLCFK